MINKLSARRSLISCESVLCRFPKWVNYHQKPLAKVINWNMVQMPWKCIPMPLPNGEQVLFVDDLIATRGTAKAGVALIKKLGSVLMGFGFVIDLPDLGGIQRLINLGIQTFALCEFEGE